MIKIRFSRDVSLFRWSRLAVLLKSIQDFPRHAMTQGIICSIDFSESSKQALKWTVALAKELHCTITILYTYRLKPSTNGEVVDFKKKMEAEAVHKFEILEAEMLKDSGVSYEFKTEVGFVSNRVREYSKHRKVSMLVMSNTMNAKANESFDELAQSLNLPLVIVPNK